MGMLDTLFGRKAAPAKAAAKAGRAGASQFQPSASQESTSPHGMRKDLIRMVLKETLTRNGIPASWIGADLLRATGKGKEPGLHVRLLVLHWDLRLMEHAPAFEQNFYKRVLAMDPLSVNWLLGISWQFAMDMSVCPPLPHPGSWTASPHTAHVVPPAEQVPVGVIEGPVMAKSSTEVRADLEKMLSMGDKTHRSEESFAATQPIAL
jgi:hypothetical protein